MKNSPVIVGLPIADRRKSFDFFAAGLGLLPIGEIAEDGLPEPLQFQLNDGLRLMLIPTEGFGWVVGNRDVAQSGHSECVISISAGSEFGVGELVNKALQAGGEIVSEPGQKPWGYVGAFADLDGHIWQVTADWLP
jgi:uncharacterized protein